MQEGERLFDPEFWKSATPKDLQNELTKGSGLQARDEDGETLLHYAAFYNENPAVVKTLLEAGANLEAQTKIGEFVGGSLTPLHRAAENGNPAVVTALLEAGADIEARGEGGETPLHMAAQNENPAVVTVLLEAGADLEARTVVRGGGGETPLHRAAYDNNPAIVTTLLEAGADLEARNKEGETPLHRAACHNKLVVVTTLLEAGASLEARDKTGWSPLHWATRNAEPGGRNYIARSRVKGWKHGLRAVRLRCTVQRGMRPQRL